MSLSFDFSNTSPYSSKKVVPPKIRNKKSKERPEFDILQIDSQIKLCFETEVNKLQEYHKRVSSMLKTLVKSEIPYGVSESIVNSLNKLIDSYGIVNDDDDDDIFVQLTYREFLNFYEQINKLITKIDNISSGKLLDRYLSLTSDIIDQYKKLISIPIKSAFLTKNKPRDTGESVKNDIIEKYISIAKNFIDIEFEKDEPEIPEKYMCVCGNSCKFENSEGIMICECCGLEIPIITIQTSFKDIDRINMHQKYKYEKKSHFKEGILQFQGKQNKYIDDIIYQKAEEWLEIHGLINKNANNKKDRFEKVRKEHIRLFMSESEHPRITKHYEDLNLIYSKLTDKPCPDISYLEEKLYAQFDKLVEAFINLEDVERTNFLNSQFVLKKLLILNGHEIDPQDFPGLKTASRQAEHEDLWSRMIVLTGLEDPSVRENKV